MAQTHSREELASQLKAITQNEGNSREVRLLAESALWILSELGQVKNVSNSALNMAQTSGNKAGPARHL
jgi:hypothetical protein